jgi:hypothetical protein
MDTDGDGGSLTTEIVEGHGKANSGGVRGRIVRSGVSRILMSRPIWRGGTDLTQRRLSRRFGRLPPDLRALNHNDQGVGAGSCSSLGDRLDEAWEVAREPPWGEDAAGECRADRVVNLALEVLA